MAFLSGIFNKQQPAPAAQTPVNSNGSAGPVTAQMQGPANPDAHPASMTGSQAAPAVSGPQNPLDSFTDMFKPKVADPKAAKAASMSDPFLGPLDPAAFRQQVSQANFTASIPQDTIQKAMGGDAQAFADAINHASREAFAAAAQLSHGLVEHGARTAAERVSGSLDGRIRNFQIKAQNTSNESLAHPAVAPMLNAVKIQIASSNPNLSPEQVQSQAEQYFTQMADVLTAPKQAALQKASAPKETDFSSYLA